MNSIDQAESDNSNFQSSTNNSNTNTSQSNLTSTNLISNQLSTAFKNSKENLLLIPLRMEIGLKAFVLIADTLQQQKESGSTPPTMPSTFNTPNNDALSVYLNKSVINIQRVTLTDSLAKEIGLSIYFDYVRRAFQDILKTLDFTVGRTFLMTRPENTGSSFSESIDSSNPSSANVNNSNLNLPVPISSSGSTVTSLNTGQTNSSTVNSSNTSDGISSSQLNSKNLDDLGSSTNQLSKDLIFNSDNKSKLSLFRTCIALMPRIMPLFKENELIDILTRLTIHLDDELKLIAFQTLKTLVNDYPQWRKYAFTGFTSFILKEISDLYPKLIENALKMILQLLNTWKTALSSNSSIGQNLEECCQILFHLEGFALFTLCHSHIQRRRFALMILKECKSIGELTKCFKFYPFHNYTIDVLDLASIHAMKQLHLQCFNSGLIVANLKPDLNYLIEQSASWDTSINTASYNNNENGSSGGVVGVTPQPTQSAPVTTTTSSFYNIINKNQRASSVSSQNNQNQSDTNSEANESTVTSTTTLNSVLATAAPSNQNESETQQANSSASSTINLAEPVQQSSSTNTNHTNIFTFDPWTECLAIFFSYDFIFTKCPQARVDAWPFIYTRLQQLLPFVNPNEQQHEMSRTSILFGVGSNSLEKIRKAANERDINLNLWKNYLIGSCCLTSGSDRYLYYQEYEKAFVKTDESSESQYNVTIQNPNPVTPAINVDFTVVESTSKFYTTFGTATSMLKLIVPLLKVECNYFREIVIRGLGRINIEAMRDLIDELVPYIKESLDKRQEFFYLFIK